MAGTTRTRIVATAVLEPVKELPTVQRVASSEFYDDIVNAVIDANKPGSWFRVIKDLPNASAAGSRAKNLKDYDGMEAVGRNEGEGKHSVYARNVTDAILKAEAKEAAK